jgi:coenzyme Q-binding protein COQ10
MPTHTEKRRMPYSADEMYALVADVESYAEFLPWCAASRVRERRETDAGEVLDRHRIDVEYLEGPFRYLNNHWHFEPISDTACEVDFFVDFEFRSRMLQSLIGVVFNEAMRRIVRAFEARAEALYGKREAPPAG